MNNATNDAKARAAERIRQRLGFETLATRGRDALDFHEVSAACIREAIDIAFEAGLRAAASGATTGSAAKALGITGGDWTTERDGSLVMAGQVIGIGVDGFGPDGASRREKAANAALMSAGPDLYEAMAMLIAATEARDHEGECAAIEAGRSAIAKAQRR